MTTETTVEQTEQQKQEQVKLEQSESEMGLAAGFAKVRGEPAAETKDDTTTEVAAAPAAAKTEAAPVAAKDPWEGVPPIVKQHLESLAGGVKEATQAAKSAAGRVGSIQSALDAGRKAADKAGADTPSDTQVAAAVADPESWKKFKEEFPDFAAPMEAQLGALRAELAKKGGTVNVEELEARVVASARQGAAAEADAAEERAFVRLKHPGWKATVNTEEFRNWTLAGGPSQERYAEMKALEKTDPAKAEQMVNGFARSHPQWWADRGAALFGTTANDAIKLLDGYAENTKAAATAAEKKAKNQTRLAAAVPIKGTPAPATTALPDERGLEVGFKKARGK